MANIYKKKRKRSILEKRLAPHTAFVVVMLERNMSRRKEPRFTHGPFQPYSD